MLLTTSFNFTFVIVRCSVLGDLLALCECEKLTLAVPHLGPKIDKILIIKLDIRQNLNNLIKFMGKFNILFNIIREQGRNCER